MIKAVNGEKNKLVAEVLSKTRELKPYVFIPEIQELMRGINESKIMVPGFKEIFVSEANKLCEVHTEAYSEKSFKELFELSTTCGFFRERINLIYFSHDIIAKFLPLSREPIPAGNEIIDIQIISDFDDLSKFVGFTKVINDLYIDLCRVYGIHYEDFPLSIIKVESGSLWEQIFGNSEIVKTIKELLFGIGGYIRDWQTGTLTKEHLNNQIETAINLMDLKNKAKDAGVDSPNLILLDKALKKSFKGILKALPESTTEIILDDKKLLNLSEYEVKKIEKGETKLLNKKN